MKQLLVIGAGLIGARHVQSVLAHPDCSLAGVVDPDPQKRMIWDAPGFADLDNVDVAVDAVIIASPTEMHADHAVLAARNGWHCLVEKPLAGNLEDADRMIAVADTSGISILVGHHRRYHKSVRILHDLITAGAIGKPISASLIWTVRKPDDYFLTAWRAGSDGSPIMINLVHDIDLLRFLLGDISQIMALGSQPVRQAGRIESGVLAIAFRSGATASITFADTTPSPFGFEAGTGENPNIATSHQDMLWIMGTGGAVSFPSLTLWNGASDWSEKPNRERICATTTQPLNAQLDHFIAVINGVEQPLISARDARETLAATLIAKSLMPSHSATRTTTL